MRLDAFRHVGQGWSGGHAGPVTWPRHSHGQAQHALGNNLDRPAACRSCDQHPRRAGHPLPGRDGTYGRRCCRFLLEDCCGGQPGPLPPRASRGIDSMLRRLVAEALGTGLLVCTVVGSGIMAETLSTDEGIQLLANTIPTGAILVVLITVFGPISGAHFNPAVTMAFRACAAKSRCRTALGYVLRTDLGRWHAWHAWRRISCSSCNHMNGQRKSAPAPLNGGRRSLRPSALSRSSSAASNTGPRLCHGSSVSISPPLIGSPPPRAFANPGRGHRAQPDEHLLRHPPAWICRALFWRSLWVRP